jgi:hypothetical protein
MITVNDKKIARYLRQEEQRAAARFLHAQKLAKLKQELPTKKPSFWGRIFKVK